MLWPSPCSAPQMPLTRGLALAREKQPAPAHRGSEAKPPVFRNVGGRRPMLPDLGEEAWSSPCPEVWSCYPVVSAGPGPLSPTLTAEYGEHAVHDGYNTSTDRG
jgi:hypothetical protein